MKTPREILLNRHAAANQKLDAIRREAVPVAANVNRRTLADRDAPSSGALLRAFSLFRELLWPHPKAWLGLASAWILIFAMHFATRENSTTFAHRSTPTRPEIIMALESQRQLFAELVGAPEPLDANRPKNLAPRPRSERRDAFQAA